MLTIELVPKTCWFSNLRSILEKKDWDFLRKKTYQSANFCCEICGGKGCKWPVECHEIWEYDDIHNIQRLKGLIALCPDCHEVKHIGYANTQGRGERAIKHLSVVNNWSLVYARDYVVRSFKVWLARSERIWQLDLSYLEQFNISIVP